MAESNRRGENAAEHVEDVFDDAIDDDALLDSDEAPASSARSTATKARATSVEKKGGSRRADAEKAGFFAWLLGIPRRIWLFIREVIGELRKVIWPTRADLISYTSVVVVFVAIMMTIVGLLDLAYAKGVLYIFGHGNTK